INSIGGDVYEGIAIYNTLKQHGSPVNVYIDGIAASIASVIACAGENVYIANGGSIMIHDVSAGFKVSGTSDEIKKAYENAMANIHNAKESIIDIYQSKTGKDRKYLASLMSSDNYFRGEDAVNLGIATSIIDPLSSTKLQNSLQKMRDQFNQNPQIQAALNRLFCASNLQNQNQIEPILTPEEGKDMSNTVENKDNLASAKAQAIADFKAAENKRQSDIKAIFAGKNAELMNQCLLDAECSPEAAKDKLLDNFMNAPQPNNAQPVGGIPVGVTKSDVDNKLEALHASWDNKRDGKYDGANPMNGMGMHSAAALIAKKHGIDTTGWNGQALFNLLEKDMQVTTDFSTWLSTPFNKEVIKGYELAPSTFRNFVSFGSFDDFNKKEVHMLGTIGALPLKGKENDEYKQIKLPDSEAQEYAPEERGGIIVLSRKLFINDNYGAIATEARNAGFAGALTLEGMFYDYLFSNPLLRDGKPLFHADHGNLLPSGLPTVESLVQMQALFDLHTAPNSPESFLNIMADRVLADRTNLAIISELITKETGKEAKPTIGFFDKEKLFFSQRMANKGIYYFADPNVAPVIEAGFLNGQQTPILATEEHFNSGALKWRLQLDCAVAAVNSRGAAFQPASEVGAEGKKLTKAQQKALEKEAEEKAAAEEAERLAAEEAAKNNVKV
ncbi:MAG: Clp protease ClpP, partial [Wohlfahrtiimonas sp.]